MPKEDRSAFVLCNQVVCSRSCSLLEFSGGYVNITLLAWPVVKMSVLECVRTLVFGVENSVTS